MIAVGLILLAAGESRRMGQAKQLLPFGQTSLLRHACATALATTARPVVAVLGAGAAACAAEIADLAVTVAVNARWAEGMGESLRVGLARLTELAPATGGAVIMLADQPLVTPADISALLAAWEPPHRPIAAAAYAGALGAPAVFSRALFAELAALKGPKGAGAVIARHAALTAPVEMPAAAQDLDTPEDYRRLLGRAERPA